MNDYRRSSVLNLFDFDLIPLTPTMLLVNFEVKLLFDSSFIF